MKIYKDVSLLWESPANPIFLHVFGLSYLSFLTTLCYVLTSGELNGLGQTWRNTGPLFCLLNNSLPLYFTISDIAHGLFIWAERNKRQTDNKVMSLCVIKKLMAPVWLMLWQATKGQFISERLYDVFIWTKKQMKIFLYICPSL